MGLESRNRLDNGFLDKFIANRRSDDYNTDDDLRNGTDNNEDAELGRSLELSVDAGDLSKLESKVDVYLSKIKELDPSLHERENKYEVINDRIKEFVSLEKLHRSGPENRHIYFAGIPLSHSLQLLESLKKQKSQEVKITALEREVEDLNKEINDLNEERSLQFYKFEESMQKAFKFGIAINLLIRLVERYNRIRMRVFLLKLRSLNYNLISLKFKKLNNYKVFTLVKLANKFGRSHLRHCLNVLKNNSLKGRKLAFDLPVKSTILKRNDTYNKFQRQEPNLDVNGKDMETNLLNRLENLLVQEMNMLT